MAYSNWKIVKGKGLFDKRPKRYMMRNNDGVITYHNYKEKVYTWQTKYGPYNTIKEKGGTATFYNVGKEIEINVMEQLNIEIDPKTVFFGYKF
jgi:hypothetical protein